MKSAAWNGGGCEKWKGGREKREKWTGAGSYERSIRAISECWTRRSKLVSRAAASRSEEHTSELQSHLNLVCRLLLEKKKRSLAVARANRVPHSRKLE